MSRELLINLRDYLLGTLSEDDALWLSRSLSKGKKMESNDDDGFSLDDMPFTQYKSKREMIEEGERQIAAGRCGTTEDLLRMCEERLMSVAV
ncbi:MAG: hypothetical protein IIT83_05165 [Bacteroidales bacterium]|jgi:hypothetical protein|nr:hypothetical protein [Bacteroidales bacterium]